VPLRRGCEVIWYAHLEPLLLGGVCCCVASGNSRVSLSVDVVAMVVGSCGRGFLGVKSSDYVNALPSFEHHIVNCSQPVAFSCLVVWYLLGRYTDSPALLLLIMN
jgi:hypothetical protein